MVKDFDVVSDKFFILSIIFIAVKTTYGSRTRQCGSFSLWNKFKYDKSFILIVFEEYLSSMVNHSHYCTVIHHCIGTIKLTRISLSVTFRYLSQSLLANFLLEI